MICPMGGTALLSMKSEAYTDCLTNFQPLLGLLDSEGGAEASRPVGVCRGHLQSREPL